MDDKEWKRWSAKALALLELGEVLSIATAEKAADPTLAKEALLGAARSATIRLRTRVWASFVRWLQWRRGYVWPRSIVDLMDYAAEVSQESPSPTFPRAFAGALSWFEARSWLPSEERYIDDGQLKLYLDRMGMEMARPAEATVKAPRFPVSVVAALEVAVTDENSLLVGLRVVAWCRLIKVYGVMRTDDLKRVRPADLQLGEAGLHARLSRTKTSGPDKKIK